MRWHNSACFVAKAQLIVSHGFIDQQQRRLIALKTVARWRLLCLSNSNILREKNVIRPLRESVFSYKFSKMLLRVFHCLIENPAVILRSCETIELKSALGAKECLTFLSSSRCRSPAPPQKVDGSRLFHPVDASFSRGERVSLAKQLFECCVLQQIQPSLDLCVKCVRQLHFKFPLLITAT